MVSHRYFVIEFPHSEDAPRDVLISSVYVATPDNKYYVLC